MEENQDHSFDFLNVRFLVAAFAVVATLAFVSGAVFGADGTSGVDERLGKVTEMMRDSAKETRK